VASLKATSAIGAYAAANDPYGPNGVGPNQDLEDPGYAGYNFDILTNENAPGPASLAMGCLGLSGIVALRRRR
jgi:MYXO-CTERM domain-containing protein